MGSSGKAAAAHRLSDGGAKKGSDVRQFFSPRLVYDWGPVATGSVRSVQLLRLQTTRGGAITGGTDYIRPTARFQKRPVSGAIRSREAGKSMNLASTVRIAAAISAFVLLTAVSGTAFAAEDEAPTNFAKLKFEGACDAQNNRLWLSNIHTFKTIAVTLRWKAAGGKDLVEQFFTAPNTIKEIGCAAEAEITEATFANF